VLYWFLLQQGFTQQNFIIASVMFLVASGISGYIVLLDILEQKESQDERLTHLTREILHEINLPIATIDANLSMLSKHLASSRDLKRAQRITAALDRLKRLYTELSYSIRKEIVSVEKESFDLKIMLEERVATFQELGRNPFVWELEPTQIEVDRIGLEQAIDNIIENAMKYSPVEAQIDITLQAASLTIQDHGKGMDANQILHIYERYYQGDRSQQGEGIGLALVKRYCDEEGIEIMIRSEVDRGTVVVLDFTKVMLR
jgi:signal transduction histidine kinase